MDKLSKLKESLNRVNRMLRSLPKPSRSGYMHLSGNNGASQKFYELYQRIIAKRNLLQELINEQYSRNSSTS